MANNFLNRDKKKSKWELALFFLRWKHGLAPLGLLVVLVMGLFIAPANLVSTMIEGLDKLPLGHGAAAALAKLAGSDLPQGNGDLLAALKAARQAGAKSPWSLFSRGAGGGDSLGMVRGSQQDVLGAAALASKIKGGATVNGVLSPSDSRKRGLGVELSADDLAGGFVPTAAAGGFAGGAGPGVGAYAGRGLLTGGKVAPAQEEQAAAAALKSAKVAKADGDKAVAEREGKMSKMEFRQLQVNRFSYGARKDSDIGGPGSALGSLADVRTRGQMARAPNCTKDNGCPPEYATNTSGSGYDGSRAGKRAGSVIQAAPAVTGIDGISTPSPILPDSESADTNEVDKIKAQQKACDNADANYKPLIGPHVQRIGELSRQAKTPANRTEMSRECHIMDDLMRQQYDACPLRHEDGPYAPQSCD